MIGVSYDIKHNEQQLMQIIIESTSLKKHRLVDLKSKSNMIGKKCQKNKTPTISVVCTVVKVFQHRGIHKLQSIAPFP